MKWKITSRFLISMLLVVMVVLIFNVIVLGYVMFNARTRNLFYPNNFYESGNPEIFVRDYKKYIELNGNMFDITEEGINELRKRKGWLQILDEEGYEVFSFDRPLEAPIHYSPIKIIHIHKYTGGIKGYSVFISEIKTVERNYSYLIGFPENYISKVTFYFHPDNLPTLLKSGVIIFLLIDSMIVVLFGYLFARRLSRPIEKVICGIQELAQGNYHLQFKETGLYNNIYKNLNSLAQTLLVNEKEQRLVEKHREEWISNISHDIKTPLASIKGYAEILFDPDYQFTEEERRSYVEVIKSKSKYIQELVDDLNLTTRLINSLISLNKESVNIVEFVRNIIIDILNDPLYQEHNIELVSVEETIRIDVDKKLIKRAFINLIYNGLIHNEPETKLTVKISRGEAVQIMIIDNGQGIPSEEIDQVFERFYRGTNTGELHKGSGLGMAISKQIIEAHGGMIKIDSKVNEGTKITIFL